MGGKAALDRCFARHVFNCRCSLARRRIMRHPDDGFGFGLDSRLSFMAFVGNKSRDVPAFDGGDDAAPTLDVLEQCPCHLAKRVGQVLDIACAREKGSTVIWSAPPSAAPKTAAVARRIFVWGSRAAIIRQDVSPWISSASAASPDPVRMRDHRSRAARNFARVMNMS